MKNSRLVALLQTLSNKEIKEIRKFLHDSYFNNRPEVYRLFDYLSDCIQLYKVIPSKEKAFQQILEKANYDDQKMRLWMSFLLKLVEKFLVQEALFKDEVKIKTTLTTIYRERNLPKHLERNLRELQVLQQKQIHRNAAFYNKDYQIQYEQYRFASANRRMSELNLQKMSDDLDIAYLSEKLRQSCFSLSHQTIYKTEYHFGMLPEVLSYIENQNLLDTPAIAIYYYGYQTLSQAQQAEYFQSFKKNIVDYGDLFPAEELGDIYLLAINFCIKRYNAGDRFYLKDEFELYQQGLLQNLFLKNNLLSRFTYRNIVTIALILEEFEWVEQFINDYKSKLQKEHRESMYSFSLALLEYSRKNYDLALQLLQKSPYKDLLLNLAAKTVMLKIYYELDEFDPLDAHLEAMRTFIRRKKIMGYHRENYLNLIYFTKKLMESNPFDRASLKTLHEEIEKSKPIAEKDWLLRQKLFKNR